MFQLFLGNSSSAFWAVPKAAFTQASLPTSHRDASTMCAAPFGVLLGPRDTGSRDTGVWKGPAGTLECGRTQGEGWGLSSAVQAHGITFLKVLENVTKRTNSTLAGVESLSPSWWLMQKFQLRCQRPGHSEHFRHEAWLCPQESEGQLAGPPALPAPSINTAGGRRQRGLHGCKWCESQPGVVSHTCNPSPLGG